MSNFTDGDMIHLAETVLTLLDQQARYFRTRLREDLAESKKQEDHLRKLCRGVLYMCGRPQVPSVPQHQQLTLFDDSKPAELPD